MARPSTPHQGFIIPNASDVADPILAEPDKIDFNTLANARWGVLTGCLVTGLGGASVSVSDGTVMVDGKFVAVDPTPSLTVTIPPGSPHFSLVVVNDAGQVYVISGKDSTDPVYPPPARNETVLAAVYCKTGTTIADSVIDKRKFLAPALLTKVDPAEDIIRNFQAAGPLPTDPPMNYYRVLGSGETIWSNDTHVSRTSAGTLRVDDNLSVKTKITAGDDISGLSITATEDVTSKNLRRAGSAPSDPRLGDLWQHTGTGSLFVGNKKGNGVDLAWDEVGTMSGTIPPGTIITSLEEPTRMGMAGWLALDGNTTANEHDHPNIFKVAALRPYITAGTVAPNRTMKLPDLTGRVMISNHANAGFMGPLVPGGATTRPNNNITLAIAQMPKHHHADPDGLGAVVNTPGVTGSTGQWTTHDVGSIDLSVTVNEATVVHSHSVDDDGHAHKVATARISGATLSNLSPDDTSVFTPTVAGRTKVDIDEAYAAIEVNNNTTKHSHTANPTDIVQHHHNIDVHSIGGGGAFDITPNYFTTYMYVKS